MYANNRFCNLSLSQLLLSSTLRVDQVALEIFLLKSLTSKEKDIGQLIPSNHEVIANISHVNELGIFIEILHGI